MGISEIDKNKRDELIELAKQELRYTELRRDHGVVAAENMVDCWVRGYLRGKTVGTISIDISTPNKPIAAGAQLIVAERNKQFLKGYSIEEDVNFNDCGELLTGAVACIHGTDSPLDCPASWDVVRFEKMLSKELEQRLITAGALIAAEIDRVRNS